MRNRFLDELCTRLINSVKHKELDLKLLAYLGHQAPSVHNTQPWELTLYKHSLTIVVEPSKNRHLEHSDPTYRQTWLSIGALVQNILSVASALSLKVAVKHIDNQVHLAFKYQSGKSMDTMALKTAVVTIFNRCSNRNFFKQEGLSSDIITRLSVSPAHGSSAQTVFVSNRQQIEKIGKLSYQASLLAFSSFRLRSELAKHINAPYAPRATGIPATAISSSFSKALVEKYTARSSKFLRRNAKMESQRTIHSALVALVFTSGDTQKDWFGAGLEYEKLCLQATKLGLSHSTMAVLVEAPDYYKDVSKLVGNGLRLQAVVRIGYGKSAKVRAKRLPVENVLQVADNTGEIPRVFRVP